MIGVVLAGGVATRLKPVTLYVNKHILPLGNWPMVAYPLFSLIASGIKKIVVVTGPPFGHQVIQVVKALPTKPARVVFAIQKRPAGIPDAIKQAEPEVGTESIIMVGGDNIFGDKFDRLIQSFRSGALCTLRKTNNPRQNAVPIYNLNKKLIDIVEKPQVYSGQWSICSPNLFDSSVFKLIKTLKPSQRGELELADLLVKYLKLNQLKLVKVLDYWADVGTYKSLAQTNCDIIKGKVKLPYDHF